MSVQTFISRKHWVPLVSGHAVFLNSEQGACMATLGQGGVEAQVSVQAPSSLGTARGLLAPQVGRINPLGRFVHDEAPPSIADKAARDILFFRVKYEIKYG